MIPFVTIDDVTLLFRDLTVDETNRTFTVTFNNFYTNHAKDANESLTFTYSAVVNENNEVFYMSQIEIRNDIADKMTQRSKYRRSRRNRKTRYRKARWLNRKKKRWMVATFNSIEGR